MMFWQARAQKDKLMEAMGVFFERLIFQLKLPTIQIP
jgi:hypothetical protein